MADNAMGCRNRKTNVATTSNASNNDKDANNKNNDDNNLKPLVAVR